jgi:hypothetical protein
MKIEIVEVDSNGTGYCVMHRDDDTTFGLHFSNMPLTSSNDLLVALLALAEPYIVASTEHAPDTVAVPDAIKQMLNVKQDVTMEMLKPAAPVVDETL